MAQYVKLGPKASFFRCAGLDLSIAQGEVVPLNAKQMNHPTVRRALNGGHLVLTELEKKEAPKELSAEELKEAFLDLVGQGYEAKKLAKNFSMDELKTIASFYEIEVEATDKKVDVVEALLNEVAEPEE